MLIDTHCHLNMMMKNREPFTQTAENCQLVSNAIDLSLQNNVKKIINIGTDLPSSLHSIFLSEKFTPVFCAVGIHPCDATENWKTDFEKIKQLVQKKDGYKIVGIGESGLDFYHPGFVVERQKDVFKAHIELALESNLPIVVHTRSAIDETLAVLQEYKNSGLTGVIHCFSEDTSIASDVIGMNFMLGIGGIVTYPKNEYLRDVIRSTQLESIILETDAPFLPPQIIRGKQNSPAQVATVANYIAELLEITPEEVAAKTTANAYKLFPGLQ